MTLARAKTRHIVFSPIRGTQMKPTLTSGESGISSSLFTKMIDSELSIFGSIKKPHLFYFGSNHLIHQENLFNTSTLQHFDTSTTPNLTADDLEKKDLESSKMGSQQNDVS